MRKPAAWYLQARARTVSVVADLLHSLGAIIVLVVPSYWQSN